MPYPLLDEEMDSQFLFPGLPKGKVLTVSSISPPSAVFLRKLVRGEVVSKKDVGLGDRKERTSNSSKCSCGR